LKVVQFECNSSVIYLFVLELSFIKRLLIVAPKFIHWIATSLYLYSFLSNVFTTIIYEFSSKI